LHAIIRVTAPWRVRALLRWCALRPFLQEEKGLLYICPRRDEILYVCPRLFFPLKHSRVTLGRAGTCDGSFVPERLCWRERGWGARQETAAGKNLRQRALHFVTAESRESPVTQADSPALIACRSSCRLVWLRDAATGKGSTGSAGQAGMLRALFAAVASHNSPENLQVQLALGSLDLEEFLAPPSAPREVRTPRRTAGSRLCASLRPQSASCAPSHPPSRPPTPPPPVFSLFFSQKL
jgi:hypothetical protein